MICKMCNKDKPREDFYKQLNVYGKRKIYCKTCYKKAYPQKKEYKRKNSLELLQEKNAFLDQYYKYKSNPEKTNRYDETIFHISR